MLYKLDDSDTIQFLVNYFTFIGHIEPTLHVHVETWDEVLIKIITFYTVFEFFTQLLIGGIILTIK